MHLLENSEVTNKRATGDLVAAPRHDLHQVRGSNSMRSSVRAVVSFVVDLNCLYELLPWKLPRFPSQFRQIEYIAKSNL